MTPPDGLQIALTLSTLMALWIGWAKAVRPRWRRFWDRVDGVMDTLNGRDEFIDPTTGRRVPAVPALGTRMGNMEDTLSTVANQQRLLENHETRITALENDRVKDIITSAERAATAAASANMFRLAVERDTTDGQADEPKGEVE